MMGISLDKMYTSVLNGEVPELLLKVSFSSLKPLGAWMNDVIERIEFMRLWLRRGPPASYPLSLFFFPQDFSRVYFKYIAGSMLWQSTRYRSNIRSWIQMMPTLQDGVIVHGIWIEGLGTEAKIHCRSQNQENYFRGCHISTLSQQLSSLMP